MTQPETGATFDSVKKKACLLLLSGEISPAVKNLVARDIHTDAPNKKWLTHLTEIYVPTGKVYLLPIIAALTEWSSVGQLAPVPLCQLYTGGDSIAATGFIYKHVNECETNDCTYFISLASTTAIGILVRCGI